MGESFDVLVVGGGITGAGIASLAAARGLSVALIEKEDFGSGTSWATSKMLHGGLRYLDQRAFRLVKEALRERGLLLRALGPDRVKVTPFLLPLRGGAGSALKLRFGTWLYQRLSGGLALGPRSVLSAAEVKRRLPSLSDQGLRGGVLYFEGVIDDALLTLIRVGEAVRLGAAAMNHVEATGLLLADGRRATGVQVRDTLTGATGTVRARALLNAAGVGASGWAGAERTPKLRPSKGVHLVLSQSRFPLPVAVVMDAPGSRWVFALPYGPFTIVGTTDTDFPDPTRPVRPEPEDVRYLLDAMGSAFPSLHLGAGDVLDAYAGLRPLLAGDAQHPSELSREDTVHRDPSGLLTVVGGKLTTHRAMAERALLAANVPASGAPRAGGATAPSWAFPPAWSGTPCPGAEVVWQTLSTGPVGPLSPSMLPWIESGVREAQAATLADLMDRRLHAFGALTPGFTDLVGEVAKAAAPALGWSEADLVREREDYLARARSRAQAVTLVAGASR